MLRAPAHDAKTLGDSRTGGSRRSAALGLLAILLFGCGGCLRWAPAWRLPEPAPLSEDDPAVVVMPPEGPDPALRERIAGARRLLIVIPGVDDEPSGHYRVLLAGLRRRCGHDLAVYDLWSRGFGRQVALNSHVDAAARRLADLLVDTVAADARVDVLAHSAGTYILNATAIRLEDGASDRRIHHAVLCGTPLEADAAYAALRARCERICNLHSTYDRISRNFSADAGHLAALGADNHLLSTSYGGRLIRHDSFLDNDPENHARLAWYLTHGAAPRGGLPQAGRAREENLFRLATALAQENDATIRDRARREAEAILATPNDDPVELYYAALFCGLLRLDRAEDFIELLRAPATPLYLRHEIYRMLANSGDGRHVPLLRWARKTDRHSRVLTRDILRELKRRRVDAVYPSASSSTASAPASGGSSSSAEMRTLGGATPTP